MAEYTVLITDIDDTLLNSNHEISPENLSAIQRLQAKGNIFVLASGRPNGGMQKIVETIGLQKEDSYLIAFNGGKIIHTQTGVEILNKGLSHDDFSQACDFAELYDVSICSYTKTAVVVSKDSEQSRIEAMLTGMEYKIVDDIKAFFTDKAIPKAIIFAESEKIEILQPMLREYMEQKVEITISKPIFLEITPKGVHKGEAVRFLANHLGYKLSEIIAVGDGENDIELLKVAGLGLAVANASPKLKIVADGVIVSNDEHAIAHIEEHFLK
ncbi:haloacid dehalogenase [Erysipelotrichaceae bacterium]|nr:haloacid dehalogenase [Erysipelotrichaceae bacterium]